jgi:hypothetical protein
MPCIASVEMTMGQRPALIFKERCAVLRTGTKNLSLYYLHEPAPTALFWGKIKERDFRKSFVEREINFFIFLVRSKIVQAHLAL